MRTLIGFVLGIACSAGVVGLAMWGERRFIEGCRRELGR